MQDRRTISEADRSPTAQATDLQTSILEPPTFSVVVPAYNAQDTVVAALRSALAQTDTSFEVVVVDDGSTDATASRVESISDTRIRLIRQSNAGLSAARNAGIAAARGTYVSFLDADDLWLPGYLRAMRVALAARPDAAFAYTDAWTWHENVRRFGRQTITAPVDPPDRPPDDPRELFRSLLARNYVYVSATVRRDVLDEIGGFDGAASPSEDWELWLRLAARGYRAVKAAPVLAIYRIRPGSLSSDSEVMRESLRRVLEIVATYDLDDDLSRAVRERLASHAAEVVSPDGDSSLIGRLAQVLPASARLWSFRLRPPKGVSPEVMRLLRVSQGIS